MDSSFVSAEPADTIQVCIAWDGLDRVAVIHSRQRLKSEGSLLSETQIVQSGKHFFECLPVVGGLVRELSEIAPDNFRNRLDHDPTANIHSCLKRGIKPCDTGDHAEMTWASKGSEEQEMTGSKGQSKFEPRR